MNERPRLPALALGDTLVAPKPGWFRCAVGEQQPIEPDDILGELEVLGRTIVITAPEIHGLAMLPGVQGTSEAVRDGIAASRSLHRAVGYGDVLLRVVAATATQIRPATEAPVSASQGTDHGLVFRAPTAGRFYARPSPDKAAFVSPGAELASGSVVCLLEVMKTFSRITYSGAPARVRAVLVSDGADVKAGDPLLELEPL